LRGMGVGSLFRRTDRVPLMEYTKGRRLTGAVGV
jgi:hypothetical protein